MAVHTIYFLGTAAVAPNWFGNTQLDGSAPAAASATSGWTPGTTTLSTPYWRGRWGSSAGRGNVASAASYIDATSGPAKGTGASNTTAGDSFIAGPFTGTFAAGPWTLNFSLRTVSVAVTGTTRMRVWASANADGSAARALTTATIVGTPINLATGGTTYDMGMTWSPGALTLNNEYMFFQIEWQETVIGTAAASSMVQYTGPTCSFVTTDLSTGGGATSVWSASDAAAGGITLTNGGLTATGLGTTGAYKAVRSSISKTSGKLYVEFSNSVAAANWQFSFGLASAGIALTGAPLALGNSNYSCGVQVSTGTNVSAGFTKNYTSTLPDWQPAAGVVFGLAIDFTAGKIWVSDNNVWSNSSNPAAGTTPIISFVPATVGALFAAMDFGNTGVGVWTLQPTAASQTYAAPAGFSAWDAAPASVTGTLAITQANQTIVATGNVAVGGTLARTQANQTLVAAGTVPLAPVTAALAVTQANQAIVATGGPRVSGTLTATQANQALSAAAGVVTQSLYGMGLYGRGLYSRFSLSGVLGVTQADNTLVGAGGVLVSGALSLTQANQALAAGASPVVAGGLSVNQASQTLHATGSVLSGFVGSLNLTQASQTLLAAGTAPIVGIANLTQGDQTLSATGRLVGWGSSVPCPPSMWTPTDPCAFPPGSALYGLGGYGVGFYSSGAGDGWHPVPPSSAIWTETEPCDG